MTNTELIRELRALTSAGMKDCKDALDESGWDLQKAVDIVKIKGLNIADGRTGRIASEGTVAIANSNKDNAKVMVEVNCQTDFVANSPDFQKFVSLTVDTLANHVFQTNNTFGVEMVEEARKAVVSTTKENIVVRRWWAEEAQDPTVRVFGYRHSNGKIGVLISLKAPSAGTADVESFHDLGNDLAMQIAAMNPLAISSDRMSHEDLDRQKVIFETQLKEENKPEKMWPKIMEGKFRKWNTEACLLEQESIVIPKTSVKQVIKSLGDKIGGEIQVVNFIRCQVGEGIEVKKENLADEVEKLTGTL